MTLKAELRELQSLMHRFGEHRWDSLLSQAIDAPDHTLPAGLFGGSGTLNDLIIAEENGHSLDGLDEAAANELLQSQMGKVTASVT